MDELKKLGFNSIIGALEYQSIENGNRKAILYPNENDNYQSYSYLTYFQYNNVLNHLFNKLKEKIIVKEEENIVCGLLLTNPFEYLLFSYALLKFENIILFPISSRNSLSAIEHLLKETQTKYMITTNQYFSMLNQIKENLSFEILLINDQQFEIEQFLNQKQIQCSISTNEKLNQLNQLNRIILILHSSGTTSFPKPIYLTNRYFLLGYISYLSVDQQFWTKDDIVLTWGPLFHLLGFNGTSRCILQGCAYALPLCRQFPPRTDELVRNLLVEDEISCLITVPTLLEQLIRELLEEKYSHIHLKPLQKLKFVMYGGAGCPDDLCKYLIDHNVILLSVYGSTETNITLVNNPNKYDQKWKVMQLADVRKSFIKIVSPENAQDPHEKVFIHLPNDPFKAENICNQSDGSYLVGDLFYEHENERYSILGRQDDTLVHVNGEKTNPLPIESTIRSSSFVKQILVVGHQQFCPAALIELDFDKIENLDWKIVEKNIFDLITKANINSPSHSHLIKELVYFLKKDQNLLVTPKGNLMRQKTNQQYSQLIQQIYSDYFNQKYEKEKHNQILNKINCEKYLLELFQSILGNQFTISSSIFDFSINSLQIVQLTNSICQNLCQIPLNFLYKYSTIEQIVKYLNEQSSEEDQFDLKLTEEILNNYIQLIKEDQSFCKEEKQINERIILLTGANGSLGNYLLRDFLNENSSRIKSIYCFVRGQNPFQRLLDSFQQRKLDQSILINQFNKRLFILSNLNEIPNEITDIIHSAWNVNFNLTIQQFQTDSIQQLYDLLKFSRDYSIQFHFISSIASAASGVLNPIEEKPLPIDSKIPLSQGYGQSKYIGEHLCWTANQFWKLPVNIYRVGQLSGDTINGVWNRNELAPMMIYAAAIQLKQMPDQGLNINWIPIDIASQILIQLILQSSFDYSISNDQRVFHIVNPKSISYQQYLQILQQSGIQFQIIPKDQFIETIFNSTDLSNPLIKLSSFFQKSSSNSNQQKSITFQTNKTINKCPMLNTCPQIDSRLIQLYVNYWKQTGLLN